MIFRGRKGAAAEAAPSFVCGGWGAFCFAGAGVLERFFSAAAFCVAAAFFSGAAFPGEIFGGAVFAGAVFSAFLRALLPGGLGLAAALIRFFFAFTGLAFSDPDSAADAVRDLAVFRAAELPALADLAALEGRAREVNDFAWLDFTLGAFFVLRAMCFPLRPFEFEALGIGMILGFLYRLGG
jgi:hypothetical protein